MKPFRFLWLTLISFYFFSGCAPVHPYTDLWRCAATDMAQDHWVRYAPTRMEAATWVYEACRVGTFNPYCVVRCIPPISRWHCVAVDGGGNTWYWNSIDRDVAIRNAIEACYKSTTIGECHVPVDNCTTT